MTTTLISGEELGYPVSESALIRRINRKLAKDYQKVKKARSGQGLGKFYVLNWYRNEILDYGVDLTRLAKELEVMGDCEQLATV